MEEAVPQEVVPAAKYWAPVLPVANSLYSTHFSSIWRRLKREMVERGRGRQRAIRVVVSLSGGKGTGWPNSGGLWRSAAAVCRLSVRDGPYWWLPSPFVRNPTSMLKIIWQLSCLAQLNSNQLGRGPHLMEDSEGV